MNEIVIKILSIEKIDNEYKDLPIKFSVEEKNVIYNNDGTFKSVNVSKNIFANILDEDLNKEATKKLKELIGSCFVVVETGNKIHIDKTSVKEFIYSKYTCSLDKNELLIKRMLINYLKEIINYSHDKNWEVNRKEKHKKDAKYGFYKYKIELIVKINNIDEKYNAIVLIRNASNKKKYLYDILSLKKID